MQALFRFLFAIIWTVVGASVALAIGCAGMILAFFVLFTVSGPLTTALQSIVPPGPAESAASIGFGAFCLLLVWYVAGAGAIAAVRAYRVPPLLLSLVVVTVVLATWGVWVRTELLAPMPASGDPPPLPPFPALLDLLPAAAVLGLWLGGRRGGGRGLVEGDGEVEEDEGQPART